MHNTCVPLNMHTTYTYTCKLTYVHTRTHTRMYTCSFTYSHKHIYTKTYACTSQKYAQKPQLRCYSTSTPLGAAAPAKRDGHVKRLISHWEGATHGRVQRDTAPSQEGEAPSTGTSTVARLVDAELASQCVVREGAPPVSRAMIMAASMREVKANCNSNGGSSTSSSSTTTTTTTSNTSSTADRGPSSRDSASSSTATVERHMRRALGPPPMTVGRRLMLNHLRVLDGLNHAYYARAAEPCAPKVCLFPAGLLPILTCHLDFVYVLQKPKAVMLAASSPIATLLADQLLHVAS